MQQFDETLDLDASFSFAHAMLGLAYISKGMPDRAVAAVQQARALSDARPDVIAFHGYILARAGRRREALTDLDDLRRLAPPRVPSPFLVALVCAGLEDNDRAFEWLEKAVQARSWELPTLKASPVFDRLLGSELPPRCSSVSICRIDFSDKIQQLAQFCHPQFVRTFTTEREDNFVARRHVHSHLKVVLEWAYQSMHRRSASINTDRRQLAP